MGTLKEDLLETCGELRETHISLVFLRDQRVYKVKKPVALGFLDFRTLSLRKAACDAEVALNRRLSPSVYLRVAPIHRDAAGVHRIDGSGELVEWAVEMRRLADDDAADRRLARGALGHSELDQLGVTLAHFHASCRADAAAASFGSIEAITRNVRENFEQTQKSAPEHLSSEEVAEIQRFQLGFLADHAVLFAERVAQGRVRDGHGDLRLEHVYLGAQGDVQVIDCIEFNRRFRYADVCADLAFLSMDLVWHERVDLAETLLASYARESNDFDLYRLVDFYESYRAYVRGKVSSFMQADQALSSQLREAAFEQARKYFVLALSCAREPLEAGFVCAVGGAIAAGKSTLADALARRTAAPVVDADRTRKHLAHAAATQRLGGAAFAGDYAPAATQRVYDEVFRRADAVLGSGRPVVIDASFRSRAERSRARELAARHGVPFVFVECHAPEHICRARLHKRQERPSVSDGRLEIFDAFMASYEEVNELDPSQLLRVDTTEDLPSNLCALAARLGRA